MHWYWQSSCNLCYSLISMKDDWWTGYVVGEWLFCRVDVLINQDYTIVLRTLICVLNDGLFSGVCDAEGIVMSGSARAWRVGCAAQRMTIVVSSILRAGEERRDSFSIMLCNSPCLPSCKAAAIKVTLLAIDNYVRRASNVKRLTPCCACHRDHCCRLGSKSAGCRSHAVRADWPMQRTPFPPLWLGCVTSVLNCNRWLPDILCDLLFVVCVAYCIKTDLIIIIINDFAVIKIVNCHVILINRLLHFYRIKQCYIVLYDII